MSDNFKYVHDEANKRVYKIPTSPTVTERRQGRGSKLVGRDVRMNVEVVRADNLLVGNQWKYPTLEPLHQFLESKYSEDEAVYYFTRNHEPRGVKITREQFDALAKQYGG